MRSWGPRLPRADSEMDHATAPSSGIYACVTAPERTTSSSILPRIWLSPRAWLLLIAVGLAVGVMDAGQSYVLFGALGRRTALTRVLVINVSYWMTFAALVPAVFFMADRYRLNGPFRTRHLAIHLVGAFAFVFVHFGVAALITASLPQVSDVVLARFFTMLRNYSAGNFLLYWALVIVYYTVHYYQEARQQELQAVQLQADLTKAQLQSLRSQLNPHFLFNTINSISVLASKGEQRAVVETLSRLSDLLRASLDEKRPQEIPLSDELAFITGYLGIQQTRFSDRLTVQQEIQPDAMEALVPFMILQPLVENAIQHGISQQVGAATIAIKCHRQGDTLRLQVCDTGPGFGVDVRPSRRRGIGLSNTEARLEQLYGRRHTIEYGTTEMVGATVTISLPFCTAALRYGINPERGRN